MKKLILIFICIVLCTGCNLSNENRLHDIIQTKYTNNLCIKKLQDSDFKFLVQLPSGEVRYIELLGPPNNENKINEISLDVQYFKPVIKEIK